MATGTGVNVSKLNVYSVLTPPKGVDVSKLNTYAVLTPPVGTAVSKLVVYAVLGVAVAPSWNTFTFGNGILLNPYSQSFTANGTAVTYSIVAGALPTGLSLTGHVISGTPTVAGTYGFTIRATNSFGSADFVTSISILNPTGGGGVSVYLF